MCVSNGYQEVFTLSSIWYQISVYHCPPGYNPQPQDIQYLRTAIPAYHRIAETFKFGFAERTHLADPDFVDVKQVKRQM